MSDSDSTPSDGPAHHENVDRFEDIFVHHIAEIEQVWKQLNVARAMNTKVGRSNSTPPHPKMHYPIKLSAIHQIANLELQEMRQHGEGEDEGVAESIEKEAGMLLSFLGSMFVENLMVKTMYHLPHSNAFGFQEEPITGPVADSSTSTSSSSVPTLDPGTIFSPSGRLKPVELVISREDVRRALLRDEQFDFLVQSGHAQPDLESPADLVEDGDDHPMRSSETNSDRIHLGYWKIIERTFSALEIGSSPSFLSSAQSLKTKSHRLDDLKSKVLMSLTPETDPSHCRFTLFPNDDDLEHNTVQFLLTTSGQHEKVTKARITGRVELGHVIVSTLEGLDVDLFANVRDLEGNSCATPSQDLPPMNFSWKSQNEMDPNFPLTGRPTPAGGHGSVQLLDPSTALTMFGSKWLEECSWGVMSLDLVFALGDTGFNLHNHYLAIPIFVQPPNSQLSSSTSELM